MNIGADEALDVVFLTKMRRGDSGIVEKTPGNTEKGTRELVTRGHNVRSIASRTNTRGGMVEKVTNGFAYLASTLRMLTWCRSPNVVLYTSTLPWIRIVAALKRLGIISNRLVIRWTANDISYSDLLTDPRLAAHYSTLMAGVDACWVVSERERLIWAQAVPSLQPRIAFWPTPVDVSFYRDRKPPEVHGRIVAVGSDYKRDWATVIALAEAGVPVTIITEDPAARRLAEAAGDHANLKLEYRIGFEKSADLMAGATAILLSTKPNDRFSGSTTIGVASALSIPVILDEPHDIAAYGLLPNVNCKTYTRGNISELVEVSKYLLASPADAARIGAELAKLAPFLDLMPYTLALESSMRGGWHAGGVDWRES